MCVVMLPLSAVCYGLSCCVPDGWREGVSLMGRLRVECLLDAADAVDGGGGLSVCQEGNELRKDVCQPGGCCAKE